MTKKFLLDSTYLMYHVARIINIRTDITDKQMMTSIMVIEIWPSPTEVTSDFSRIICPFFPTLFLVLTSTLIWFPVKKVKWKFIGGLLTCTLISENPGLQKLRSVSNSRKISGPANLDFFLGLHLEKTLDLYHKPKLYIPSTINIDLILWHTQLIVCAVK